VKWFRFLVVSTAVGAAVYGLLYVPLPYPVAAPVVLRPLDARHVYVTTPGALVETVQAGRVVTEGETLARLKNRDLDLEISELEGRREILLKELETLRSRSALEADQGESGAASQIPTTEQALEDTRQRLAKRRADAERLELLAPVDGVVLSPPRRQQELPPGQLSSWTGSPLKEINLSAYLETGTRFCSIGNPQRMQATAVVDQGSIRRIQANQRVRIQLDQSPGRLLEGTVAEISQLDVQAAPEELVAAHRLPMRVSGSGAPELVGSFYEVTVSLDQQGLRSVPGAIGRARIYVPPRTLGQRLMEYLAKTFRMQS
jgi:putative peptide zinc metalloprotease protein